MLGPLNWEKPGNVSLTPTFPPFTPYCYSSFHRDMGWDCLRKDKAWEGISGLIPNQCFLLLFPLSSFSFAFLLCVSGTIFMFSSSMVYNVAVKQTFTPFSFYRQWSGSKCERYNCHAHSFAASDQWWLQAFWDCGTRGRGKLCWSWREGKACWTKVLWLILIALGIWQGKTCKFIQFLIPSSTS